MTLYLMLGCPVTELADFSSTLIELDGAFAVGQQVAGV